MIFSHFFQLRADDKDRLSDAKKEDRHRATPRHVAHAIERPHATERHSHRATTTATTQPLTHEPKPPVHHRGAFSGHELPSSPQNLPTLLLITPTGPKSPTSRAEDRISPPLSCNLFFSSVSVIPSLPLSLRNKSCWYLKKKRKMWIVFQCFSFLISFLSQTHNPETKDQNLSSSLLSLPFPVCDRGLVQRTSPTDPLWSPARKVGVEVHNGVSRSDVDSGRKEGSTQRPPRLHSPFVLFWWREKRRQSSGRFVVTFFVVAGKGKEKGEGRESVSAVSEARIEF